MKSGPVVSAIATVILGALGILFLEAYRAAMPLAYAQEMAQSTYLLLLFIIIGMMGLSIAGAFRGAKQ